MAAASVHSRSSLVASRLALRSHRVRPQPSKLLPACRVAIARAHQDNNANDTDRDLASDASRFVQRALVALVPLATASAAYADDVESPAAATAGAGGFGPGEAVLLLTPVLVYALFNVYREKINPQAKYLDYIYIMATLAIFANLFSILVFKTRFF